MSTLDVQLSNLNNNNLNNQTIDAPAFGASIPSSSTLVAPTSSAPTLGESVRQAMQRYLSHLDGASTHDLYDMVLSEVERPMLEIIMQHLRGNQSKAAIILGISRGTLRKKLKAYDLDRADSPVD